MKLKQLILSLFFALSLASAANAETSLWKVEGPQGQTLYIGGTIHMLRPEDYPLPPEFDDAYARASRLVMEMNFSKIDQNQVRTLILTKATLPRPETLDSHISKETYQALESYCIQKKLDISMFRFYRPGFVALMLLSMEIDKINTTEGVDIHFANQATETTRTEEKAAAHPPELVGLETMEDQLDIFLKLGETQGDQMIAEMIKGKKENAQEEANQIFDLIVKHWREGDEEGLWLNFGAPMKQEQPAMYEALVIRRNQSWLSTIEKMVLDEGTELILVGALHLVGPDGLLAMLREKGYRVEKYQIGEKESPDATSDTDATPTPDADATPTPDTDAAPDADAAPVPGQEKNTPPIP